MKTNVCAFLLRRTAGAIAVAAATAALTGCATTQGYQVAGKSSDIAAETSTQIAETRDAVARAAAALDGIAEPAGARPVTVLEEFASAVERADESWGRARESHGELLRSTDAYFSAWARDIAVINDQGMRETANERRRSMTDAIGRLREQFTETRNRFEPYLAQLKNLRTVLQNDFTEAGVSAADDVIEDTRRDAGDVRAALNDMAEAAEDVANRFATAG